MHWTLKCCEFPLVLIRNLFLGRLTTQLLLPTITVAASSTAAVAPTSLKMLLLAEPSQLYRLIFLMTNWLSLSLLRCHCGLRSVVGAARPHSSHLLRLPGLPHVPLPLLV